MDAWKILGIQSTYDTSEVKRAYAKLLKVYRPESDPEEFQRIREAYEEALEHIKHGAGADVNEDAEAKALQEAAWDAWEDDDQFEGEDAFEEEDQFEDGGLFGNDTAGWPEKYKRFADFIDQTKRLYEDTAVRDSVESGRPEVFEPSDERISKGVLQVDGRSLSSSR